MGMLIYILLMKFVLHFHQTPIVYDRTDTNTTYLGISH